MIDGMSGRKWVALLFAVVAAGASSCGSSSPELIAEPTPVPPSFCSFLWIVPEGNGALDWYEVDVLGGAWSSGATTLGSGATAFYVLGYDPSTMTFETAGMTTDGAIELTATGADTGAKAGFVDHGGKTFFDASGLLGGYAHELGPHIATGGMGNFDGVLSSADPATPITAGNGAIAVRYDAGGVNATFGPAGDGVQYAYCAR